MQKMQTFAFVSVGGSARRNEALREKGSCKAALLAVQKL
jgi:hypothetical protein